MRGRILLRVIETIKKSIDCILTGLNHNGDSMSNLVFSQNKMTFKKIWSHALPHHIFMLFLINNFSYRYYTDIYTQQQQQQQQRKTCLKSIVRFRMSSPPVENTKIIYTVYVYHRIDIESPQLLIIASRKILISGLELENISTLLHMKDIYLFSILFPAQNYENSSRGTQKTPGGPFSV